MSYLTPALTKVAIGLLAVFGVTGIVLSPWLLVAVLPLGVLVLVWAPCRVWSDTDERLKWLEEERKPELEAEPSTSEHRHAHGIEAAAVLKLRNLGLERLEECYARVTEAIWHCPGIIDGERKEFGVPQFENEDIYLRWRGLDPASQYRSVQTEAIVEVALSPMARGNLCVLAAAGHGRQYELFKNNTYTVTIEVGAKNSAPIRRTYRLSLSSPGIEMLGLPADLLADSVEFCEAD